MAHSLRSDWLSAFAVFASRLNFTHAARELHLSQPALHVQIGRLSESLGAPLYARRGRRLELTAAGTRLLAFAREGEERERSFIASLEGRGSPGPVALCAGEGAYLHLLGQAIKAFARRRPEVALQLLVRDAAGTVEAVRSGEVHVGIAAFGGTPKGLCAEPICEVGQVVVLPASHPLARKRSLGIKDLGGLPLVVPPEGRPHRIALERALHEAGGALQVAAEANGWQLMVHFVGLGLGLSVVNGFCQVPRSLVRRPLRGMPSVPYAMLTRQDARHGEDVALLRRLVLTHGEAWRTY